MWFNRSLQANAGWRWQFRFRGQRHEYGVAEFCLALQQA